MMRKSSLVLSLPVLLIIFLHANKSLADDYLLEEPTSCEGNSIDYGSIFCIVWHLGVISGLFC